MTDYDPEKPFSCFNQPPVPDFDEVVTCDYSTSIDRPCDRPATSGRYCPCREFDNGVRFPTLDAVCENCGHTFEDHNAALDYFVDSWHCTVGRNALRGNDE